ncbi:MAG: LAGLIDADG family homing endonuclease [Thermodesulfobacteriota bacterium]
MVKLLGDTVEKIYDDFLDQLDRALDDMADFVLSEADENLRSANFSPAIGEGAFDRGTLARSGRVERKRLKKKVIFDAFHAPFIEFGCYSADTEVLTTHGWKSITKCTINDIVCTLNVRSGKIEYSYPKKITERDWSGDLLHFKNRYLDLLVTPDHRMLMYNRNKKNLHFRPAKSILKGYRGYIPTVGSWKGNSLIDVEINKYMEQHFLGKQKEYIDLEKPTLKINPLNFANFLGLIISEGNIENDKRYPNKNYRLNISQTKQDGCLYIQNVLDKLPFKYIYDGKKFRISNVQLVSWLAKKGLNKLAPFKRIPREFLQYNKTFSEGLLEALLVGDGSTAVTSSGSYPRYHTSSIGLASDVQELALKCGFWSYIGVRDLRGEFSINNKMYKRNFPSYTVYIKKSNSLWVDARTVSLYPYSGKVYCLSVSNGNFYVRRNGKPTFCGNTRPHMPPLDPILAWVKRKIRVQVSTGTGRKRKTRDAEALKIANAIRFSIAKNGTLPRPFFRRAIDSLTVAEIDRIVKNNIK